MIERLQGVVAVLFILVPGPALVWMAVDLNGRAQAVLDLPEGPQAAAAAAEAFSAATSWSWTVLALMGVVALVPLVVLLARAGFWAVDLIQDTRQKWTARRLTATAEPMSR